MSCYLLDSNILIAAFDKGANVDLETQQKARQRLRDILSSPQNSFAITSLIRYEVLRGIKFLDEDRYAEFKKSLDEFTEFDITREIAELSAHIFRFDRQSVQPVLYKRQFDVMHFATAVCEDLQMVSNDKDMQKIDELHRESLK